MLVIVAPERPPLPQPAGPISADLPAAGRGTTCRNTRLPARIAHTVDCRSWIEWRSAPRDPARPTRSAYRWVPGIRAFRRTWARCARPHRPLAGRIQHIVDQGLPRLAARMSPPVATILSPRSTVSSVGNRSEGQGLPRRWLIDSTIARLVNVAPLTASTSCRPAASCQVSPSIGVHESVVVCHILQMLLVSGSRAHRSRSHDTGCQSDQHIGRPQIADDVIAGGRRLHDEPQCLSRQHRSRFGRRVADPT